MTTGVQAGVPGGVVFLLSLLVGQSGSGLKQDIYPCPSPFPKRSRPSSAVAMLIVRVCSICCAGGPMPAPKPSRPRSAMASRPAPWGRSGRAGRPRGGRHPRSAGRCQRPLSPRRRGGDRDRRLCLDRPGNLSSHHRRFRTAVRAGTGLPDSLDCTVDRRQSISIAGVANLPTPGFAPFSMILVLDRALAVLARL